MTVGEIAADSGPVAVLLGILAKLAHGMLAGILAEVKALRAELVAHTQLDDKRHTDVVVALQQRWASQP